MEILLKSLKIFLRRERDANGSRVMYFYNINTNEDVALY